MLQQHKVQKSLRKKDRLVELPEGILCAIISKLTFKEAVRTSSLSKAWRFVWRCHPHLLVDSKSLLFDRRSIYENLVYSRGSSNPQPDMIRQFERRKFVERVDHIINQRAVGPKIDSLTILYNLGEDCASQLTRWIKYAILKGVEEIYLDLSVRGVFIKDDSSSSGYKRYEFCCTLLACDGNECTVKHLSLASCSLSSISWPKCLKSLVTVSLNDVKISDLQLKSFLMICPSLQRLTLNHCQDLVNIEVAGLGLGLKFLRVSNCLRLMTVNIRAEGLVLLDYTGEWVEFLFESVPRLTKMFLSFTGTGREEGVAYALSGLANNVPQLETLNLVCLLSLENPRLAEKTNAFSNIQQLLTVLPFPDEDELVWIGYILKAFPMLRKLDINLFSPNYTKPLTRTTRHLLKTRHQHLSHLVVNGFNGYPHEVKLLKHLLKNIAGLEVLVVSRWKRLYRGFENWADEKPSIHHKLSEEILEWLRKAASPTVDLRIQD